MDPNAALERIRTIHRALMDDPSGNLRLVDELLELLAALDEWLSKGGFLPSDWTNK